MSKKEFKYEYYNTIKRRIILYIIGKKRKRHEINLENNTSHTYLKLKEKTIPLYFFVVDTE